MLFLANRPSAKTRAKSEVAARKNAEAALEEREERYQTLVRISPDAITASDLHGRITEVSDRTLKLHGYEDASQLVGGSAFSLIAPEDLKKARENSGKVLRAGYLGNAQYTLLRKDGSRFIGEMNVSLMRAPSGKPAGFMASVRDVTKRRKAEMRLTVQYAIADILEQGTSLDKASPEIIKAVCGYLGWDWGELWMVDHALGGLRCAEIWHDPSLRFPEFENATRGVTFKLGMGLPGRAWAKGKPVWITDVTKDRTFLRAHAAVKARLRGAFAFPILLNRKVLGVMTFFTRDARDPDEDLLRTFDSIGHHIGQFIQRKRAEGELRDSEERFRKVFEEGRIGISMVGLDNRFIRANRALCGIVGYSESELKRMTFADITHPEEVSRDLGKARLLRAGRIPFYRVEKRYIRKDGRIIWVSLRVSVIHGKDGKPIYFLVMTEDISVHKEMEDALMESENKHRIIVENSHDCVMITRPDSVITYLSPACKEVLGYAPEELVGQKPMVIHPDDHDKVTRIFIRAMEGERGSNVEYRVLTKNGDAKWVSHSWSPIFAAGVLKMVVSVVRDISERKKMESFRKEYYLMVEKEIAARNRELKQLQGELDRRDRLIDDFKRFAMEKEAELAALRREMKRLK